RSPRGWARVRRGSAISSTCGVGARRACAWKARWHRSTGLGRAWPPQARGRSEEHTSELQSQSNLVCRLLLEKKKKKKRNKYGTKKKTKIYIINKKNIKCKKKIKP